MPKKRKNADEKQTHHQRMNRTIREMRLEARVTDLSTHTHTPQCDLSTRTHAHTPPTSSDAKDENCRHQELASHCSLDVAQTQASGKTALCFRIKLNILSADDPAIQQSHFLPQTDAQLSLESWECRCTQSLYSRDGAGNDQTFTHQRTDTPRDARAQDATRQ